MFDGPSNDPPRGRRLFVEERVDEIIRVQPPVVTDLLSGHFNTHRVGRVILHHHVQRGLSTEQRLIATRSNRQERVTEDQRVVVKQLLTPIHLRRLEPRPQALIRVLALRVTETINLQPLSNSVNNECTDRKIGPLKEIVVLARDGGVIGRRQRCLPKISTVILVPLLQLPELVLTHQIDERLRDYFLHCAPPALAAHQARYS